MNSVVPSKQRGIAMMVVLFALLLLSVVGLGMMYSTNMETSINGNYRDKQTAFYAAMAGLQEARDRINQATVGAVTLPAALPSIGTQNVIYIVSNGSTVKPWDYTNAYADSELCQEHVLGLPAGTTGVPCSGSTSLPSLSSTWYLTPVYDDSTSTAWGPPGLAYPLDWKWSRITIKGNNMTPYPINGNSSSTAQVCWNGVNEMSTPSAYTTGCQPVGSVSAVNPTNGGTGYTSAPTVTLTSQDGNGGGAVATAVTTSETTGYISSITVTTGGVYTSNTPPTITLTGGGGSGATATASMSVLATTVSGYVSAIALGTSGSGYTSAPTVQITGGGGSGATATAQIATSTTVTSVTGFNAGNECYLTAPSVTFSGGGGSTQATATAVLESNYSCIHDWSFTGGSPPSCSGSLNSGQGYSPSDTSPLTFVSPYSAFTGVVNTTSSHKTLLSAPACCTVTNPGYDTTNYNHPPTFSTTLKLTGGGSSTDCNNFTVTATVGKRVQSITLNTNGSGYTSTPTISVSAGVGSTAPSATATIGTLGVTGITLTAGGTGYTSTPTVTLVGGGGSGATATASVVTTSTTTYQVSSITVGPSGPSSGGSGYTSAPTVSFSGGNQTTPATATSAIMTRNSGTYTVTGFTISNGGSGYTSNPTVTITPAAGDTTGNGATATSTISGGTKFGQVYMLTSFAQTKTGARSMVQMEVAMPVLGFNPGGALTLDGPNPTIDAMPNSMNFVVNGTDSNSCHDTPDQPHPAIDGYDDPNASPATHSVATIIGSLPRPDHYTGAGPSPSVENGYAALGQTMTDPTNLYSILSSIHTVAAARGTAYTGTTSSVALGSCPTGNVKDSSCQTVIDYVDGDLNLGPTTGYGILAVTGTLTWAGNFGWDGLIFVVGDGKINFSGGGNGQIIGTLFDAKIWDASCTGSAVTGHGNLCSSVQSPSFHWNGGGGNGIQFDHCWASNLMNQVPLGNFSSGKLGKMVSFRILPY